MQSSPNSIDLTGNKVAVGMDNQITMALVVTSSNLEVDAVVDGGTQQPLSDLNVDDATKTFTGFLPNADQLSAGSHTLTLVYILSDPTYGQVEVARLGPTSFSVLVDSINTVELDPTQLDTSTDSDGDGYTNLYELEHALDPTTPASAGFTALNATMSSTRATFAATLLHNGEVLLTGGVNDSLSAVDTAELYDPVNKIFVALNSSSGSSVMTTARAGHTSTLLPDGQVLLAGGMDSNGLWLDTAEIYNPNTQSFTALPAKMTTPRAYHSATLLPNGQVLLAGGEDFNGPALDTAEVYDPVTQIFTPLSATMTSPRYGHTSTLLSNGQVLITGGVQDAAASASLKSAELYDPDTQAFTPLSATMTTPRSGHAAALLANGQVLLTGGASDANTILNSAEIFNPTTQSFTALGITMNSARVGHTSTLLPTGQVALIGGITDSLNTVDSVELYQFPSRTDANTFTALDATMISDRAGHGATLLPNGKVLLTGGTNDGTTSFNSAELYDPETQTYTALSATMTSLRYDHTSTLLPDGKVLLTGGDDGTTALNTAELYDPATQTFTALLNTMTSPREAHTATLLSNGLVLLAGGKTPGTGALDTAELYSPLNQQFTPLSRVAMTTPRAFHAASLLPDGQVLLTGGEALNTAELYNPITNTFTAVSPTMTVPRGWLTSILLPNGKVLLAGGTSDGLTALNTAEIFDPDTQTFSDTGATMTSPRFDYAAALLPTGQVLISGGTNGAGTALNHPAEIYTPTSQ